MEDFGSQMKAGWRRPNNLLVDLVLVDVVVVVDVDFVVVVGALVFFAVLVCVSRKRIVRFQERLKRGRRQSRRTGQTPFSS